jgi:hypothetical protein
MWLRDGPLTPLQRIGFSVVSLLFIAGGGCFGWMLRSGMLTGDPLWPFYAFATVFFLFFGVLGLTHALTR